MGRWQPWAVEPELSDGAAKGMRVIYNWACENWAYLHKLHMFRKVLFKVTVYNKCVQ